MPKKLIDDILSYFISKKIKTVILSISGGVDSIFLFYLLISLQNKIKFKIILYHTNYNSNQNSHKSLELINIISKKHNIPFFYDTINIEKKNFESKARYFRYNKLNQLFDAKKADIILTAHHFDDQIETLIMKDEDKADWVSMLGIRHEYNNLYRPLLDMSKNSIIKYSVKNNFKWFEDITNMCTDFKRNNVRKKIRQSFYSKKYIDSLLIKNEKSKKMMILFKRKYNNKLSTFIDKISFNSVTFKTEVIDFINSIEEFKLFIVKLINLYLTPVDIVNTRHHWNNIFNVIKKSKQGSVVTVFDNIKILKDRKLLIIYLDQKIDSNYKIKVNVKDEIDWYNSSFSILKSLPNNKFKSFFKIPLKYIDNGLYVTHWLYGDKILQNNNTKKISDLFINNKISKIDKKYYPIVRDNKNNILWIPEIAKAKYSDHPDSVYITWANK